MEKQSGVMETSFWVLGHRVDVLSYLFRFFTVFVPEDVEKEVLASDPRYPQRVYGYQEMYRLFVSLGLLKKRNPKSTLPLFHSGEAAAIALAEEEGWWLFINEQRPLTFARQRDIKAVTAPEFIVYLYQARILSFSSTQKKLDLIAHNTAHQVMQAARQEFLALAQSRGDYGP